MNISGVRVLYVDDQNDMCDLMVLLMGHHGVELDAVRTFDEAVKVLHLYKVLITDQDLSCCGKNGNLLAKMFKELRPDGFVIMVTGWGQEDRPVDEHINTCMIKPIDLPTMVKAVQDAQAA